MGNRRIGPKITIQQILNMCSVVPEESISIKGIIAEFKKIKISVKETAVYHHIHRMEGNALIQSRKKELSRMGRVGIGPREFFLTEKGLAERDALNKATPQPPKPEFIEEPAESGSQTVIRSIGDYLQMPVIK